MSREIVDQIIETVSLLASERGGLDFDKARKAISELLAAHLGQSGYYHQREGDTDPTPHHRHGFVPPNGEQLDARLRAIEGRLEALEEATETMTTGELDQITDLQDTDYLQVHRPGEKPKDYRLAMSDFPQPEVPSLPDLVDVNVRAFPPEP